MPNLISFDDAIAATNDKDRSLLLGNGFSIRYFSYRTLLEEAELKDEDPLKQLFFSLDTYDFEAVIKALEDAAIVESAYGNDAHQQVFIEDARRLREALVHAIRTIHPSHREDVAPLVPSCIVFLKLFTTIFTLNYDLLLYWVQLEDTSRFSDGFGLGEEANGFRGPFKTNARCNVYNLHGGLHLFRTAVGDVKKRLMHGGNGIIDAIAETIIRDKRLPIYVAEGTSNAKLAKINSVPYLRYCYDTLSKSSGNLFVYGHSAAQNDAHIYRALFKSEIDHLYFCIHQPSADINLIDGELARYKRQYSSAVDYTFVDSESAHVWGDRRP